jgi:hypothetical protein
MVRRQLGFPRPRPHTVAQGDDAHNLVSPLDRFSELVSMRRSGAAQAGFGTLEGVRVLVSTRP